MNKVEKACPTHALPSPEISVIVANFRCARHLPACLNSILSQTVRDIEVVVSDDASPDDSVAVVRDFMRRDPRVRLVNWLSNGGPGAARNRGLGAARGDWIAIVDSDDIIHPERLEIMLAAARTHGADLVADDLIYFSEAAGAETGATLLGSTAGARPRQVSTEYFIRSNTSGAGLPALGYLKPLFRRSAIGTLRYDETARIGEDYDFLLRCLLGGKSLFLLPQPLYFYRRHASSISHRLSEAAVAAMIAGQQALEADYPDMPPNVRTALQRRMVAMKRGLSFEQLVSALKGRKLLETARLLAKTPALVVPLARSLREHFSKRPDAKAEAERPFQSLILRGKPHADSGDLNLALGFGIGSEIIDVPNIFGASAQRQLWSDLIRIGGDTRILSYGLAGLYAAPYALGQVAAVVIDEPGELSRALELCAAAGLPLIASDAILAGQDVQTTPICPGFHRIIPPLAPEPLSARQAIA